MLYVPKIWKSPLLKKLIRKFPVPFAEILSPASGSMIIFMLACSVGSICKLIRTSAGVSSSSFLSGWFK